MKPSNTGFSNPSTKTGTGIDWIVLSYDAPMTVQQSRDDVLIPEWWASACEWAAQFAIAKYRKELAARAEKRLTRYYPNGENDMGASDYGEYYERVEVLALLNENDDAE